MHAILHDAHKPASSINPAVPPAVDALLGQLLAKDKEQRPATGRSASRAIASRNGAGAKRSRRLNKP
jgi:hypothetical protein